MNHDYDNHEHQCENEFLASFSQNISVNYERESCTCTCSSTCIRKEINNLKSHLERMEEKLDSILQKMDTNVIKNCDKMGEHIDFVNNVYDTVKVPLHYISNKVQKMIGGTTPQSSQASQSSQVSQDYIDKNIVVQKKIEYYNNATDDEYLFTEND